MKYLLRYSFLFWACLIFTSFSQQRESGNQNRFFPDSVSYNEKLYFIKQLSAFIKNDFGLEPGEKFYTTFQLEDKPLYYVYYSSPDSVYCSSSGYQYRIFGTDEEAAIECQKEFNQKGFHTMLYHTAGASSAQLNSLLISYRYETIAFILFHEAMHRHLVSKNAKVPYEIVEAVCDILGNHGPISASKKLKKIAKRTTTKQLKINEKIYSVVNKYDACLKQIREKNSRDSIFNLCANEIRELLLNGDDFQNDRFNYSVNNAYFIRIRDYAKNYFLLRDVYLKLNNPKDFLDFIVGLPEEKSEVIKSLLEKSKK